MEGGGSASGGAGGNVAPATASSAGSAVVDDMDTSSSEPPPLPPIDRFAEAQEQLTSGDFRGTSHEHWFYLGKMLLQELGV